MRSASLRLYLVLSVASVGTACQDAEALRPVVLCSPEVIAEDSPVAHGREVLDRALSAIHATAPVRIVLANDGCVAPLLEATGTAVAPGSESFAIVASEGQTYVIGSDPTGAMYGALELAERIDDGETLPLSAPIAGTPDMPIRAGNFFLLLPRGAETFADWWFYDESFWREYLDMLARARLNVLDLHGMYALESTLFPNALLYFANSASFPDVGVSKNDRARNVAMLRTIVKMAAARGVKVGLMTYRSDLSLDGAAPAPMLTDGQVETYTREAAGDLARAVPNLWRLGFRIWESTHPPSFYASTFVAGVRDSGTNVGLYSRSWGTSKSSMLDIVNAAGGDVIVEVKYNGEQLGPPYVIAGGVMGGTSWWNYSYADYLDNPEPYTFVFQVRSGGTHRLFRHASFERIKRTVAGAKLGVAKGISLEAAHAFYPVRDDYHAEAADQFSSWTFRRDELQYMMFGRLAYDPKTPEGVFRKLLAQRTGADALWAPVQAASDIVPWIQSVHTCGPDQRQFAADLEWGGTVGYWATPPSTKDPTSPCETGYHGPFDTLAFATPIEVARSLTRGPINAKLSPIEVAGTVLSAANAARTAALVPVDPSNAEARDIVRECIALADLGEYFGHKLRAATALAIYGEAGRQDYLDAARSETKLADDAWTTLGVDTSYIAPFVDTMRMGALGMPTYHWSMQTPHLGDDPASIDAYVAAIPAPKTTAMLPPASAVLDGQVIEGPGLVAIDAKAPANGTQTIEVRFAHEPPVGASVRVLFKAFSGLERWHHVRATRAGDVYRAQLNKADAAGFFAVEVVDPKNRRGWHYPDVRSGAPYVVVSPSP